MGVDPPGRRFAPVFRKRPPNPPTQGTDGGVRIPGVPAITFPASCAVSAALEASGPG